MTWEENKAICNDNQLSHQYTSSVPGFQSTNIVHPSKLYTPKSPAADSAALGMHVLHNCLTYKVQL